MIALKLLMSLVGIWIIGFTLVSAIRWLVLPRGENVWLSRMIFIVIRRLFEFRLKFYRELTYQKRDRVMAFFAPIATLTMPMVWLTLVTVGYTPIYWALDVGDVYESFLLSGSSLLTLGYAPVMDWATMLLSFSEAAIGLILIALLIAFLPTMYSAFSEREKFVSLLEVRAGDPPSGVTMLRRMQRNGGFDYMEQFWLDWERMFAQLQESHTLFAPLIFFRSPSSNHSWITASGAVLDAAALIDSVVDLPRSTGSVLCIRAGYLALRDVADFFDFAYDDNPKPDDPISISREEFDEAVAELRIDNVPIVDDLDQAWLDFRGWRVNYDSVLLLLAGITMAPYAPWSSDRSLPTSFRSS